MKRIGTITNIQYLHTGHIDIMKLIIPVQPVMNPIVGVGVESHSVNSRRGDLLANITIQMMLIMKDTKLTHCHDLSVIIVIQSIVIII
jgi:hypothetical protein